MNSGASIPFIKVERNQFKDVLFYPRMNLLNFKYPYTDVFQSPEPKNRDVCLQFCDEYNRQRRYEIDVLFSGNDAGHDAQQHLQTSRDVPFQ